ncbi:MAG: M23 family metallopeptidase [Pseudomonadota bacterium]
MRRERKPSRTRALLWFLLGALVGANAMYYAMTRDLGRPFGLRPAPASDRVETPIPIGDGGVPQSDTSPPSGTTSTEPVLAPPVVRAAGDPSASAGAALLPAGQLLVPVQGVTPAQLVDTFTDSRSEGRSHDAIDIMAPHGTPVLAVADGRVEKLFTSRLGGLTVYQFNRERTHAYYYAHLQGYAPGLVEQRELKRGEVLGYVGVTGNSNPDGPHLHFAIFELGPEKQWWKGTAINPFGPLGGVARPR